MFLGVVLRNGDVTVGLGLKLIILKECIIVVILKLFFFKIYYFYLFLVNCVENGEVECFNKILWLEVNCKN